MSASHTRAERVAQREEAASSATRGKNTSFMPRRAAAASVTPGSPPFASLVNITLSC